MTTSQIPSPDVRQELYEIIRRDLPFNEKARDALEHCSAYLDADVGYLTRIDPETDHWEAIVTTDSADGHHLLDEDLDLHDTYCRETIEGEAPHTVHDPPNTEAAAGTDRDARDPHWYLGIPLILEDGPSGTVCFYGAGPTSHAFGDDEILVAELLTRLLEREFERATVETELTSQRNLATELNRDSTGRRQRERDLRTFKRAVEASSHSVYITDPDGIIQYANPAFEAITGYSAGEAVGHTPRILKSGEHDEAFYEELWTTIRGGETWHGELINSTKDGDTYVVNQTISPILDDNGEITNFVAVNADITERTEREWELEQYREAFRKAGDGMTITDDEARIMDVNREAARIYGEDRQSLIGRQMREFLPNEFDFEAEWGAIRAAQMKRDEMPITSTDGGIFSIEYTAKPNFIPGRHLIVSRDITERRERERKLEQQIERLDNFVSILSHDLRNPLTVAQGRLELASQEYDSEHFEPIEQAHKRMEALIGDLLTLARDGSAGTDTEPIELSRLAEACWGNVETSDASLVIDRDSTIAADETRLKQVFENLFRNAVEHAGADTTVQVGVEDGTLYVEDDGPGIPADERETVFEDGYSTREAGTGFGLSIVMQVVEAHGWDVRVTASSNGGARFEISGVEFWSEQDG